MCPAFCSFGAKLFIVNLLIKTDSTVICVPRMLEHVCYEPFSYKLQIWKIPYANWLKFTRLRAIKEKSKTKRLCTLVLGTSVQNFTPLAS